MVQAILSHSGIAAETPKTPPMGCDMTTTAPPATWYPIDQAATALGVSRRTVQRRVAAGEIQSTTRDDGRTWVLVSLDTDQQADALVGLQAVERNEALAQQLVEAHRGAVSLYQHQVERLESELSRQRRGSRWGWGLAAAGLVLSASGGAAVAVLSAKQGVTAGQLSATVSQLEDARRASVEQEAALASLQGDLDAARQGVTAATVQAALSGQEADLLRDRVSCLEEELRATATRRERERDMAYLMSW
jgi:hypothetical protein